LKKGQDKPTEKTKDQAGKKEKQEQADKQTKQGTQKMIAVFIPYPVFCFALFTLVCYKTDWEAIDEQNRQYYYRMAITSIMTGKS
jgi:hypothetical protein